MSQNTETMLSCIFIDTPGPSRGCTFWSRKECEGGNHAKAYGPLFHDFGPVFGDFGPLIHHLVHMHMPSRDYLLQTLFWTKKWTLEYLAHFSKTFGEK